MIRFERTSAPEGFAERVEQRGAAWLAEHEDGRPAPYWREFIVQLAEAFRSLCAYSAMHEPIGTVDHFVSMTEDRSKAYDWTNYRYASARVNSCKRNVRSSLLLDPFDVEDGWFEVLLPSLQLVLTDKVPADVRERAQFTIDSLRLVRDVRVLRQRRKWFRMYQERGMTLGGLDEVAPLIAAAIKKQQRDRDSE